MRTPCALLLLLTACNQPAKNPGTPTVSFATDARRDVAQGAAASTAGVLELRPESKNFILVTIDTLRADVLAMYGGRVATPTMERLASEGWTFEQAYSASMLTNPSHASIMTSLYPRDHGVYDNESGVHDDARTLAGAMKRAGLATAAVVNFPHLNPEVANLGQGFDSFTRALKEERRADATSRAALTALESFAPGAPFFMWVHYTDPHSPYEPPADVELPVMSTKTPMSRAVRASPGFQRNNSYFKGAFARFAHTEEMVRRYLAEVEATDRGLGVLVAGLEARGLLGETVIVITADHGENLGEHEMFFHHGGLHRQTVHVPLIVYIPGQKPGRIAGLVETVDIAPTILELAGARRWEPMRGKSLVDVAQGHAAPREVVVSEHMLGQLLATRSKDGLLIAHKKSSSQFPSYPIVAGRQDFYDLTSDPDELHPLPMEGATAESLAAHARRYLGDGPVVAAKPAFAQDRQSLRALGYVE
jgi:arylsulfatase